MEALSSRSPFIVPENLQMKEFKLTVEPTFDLHNSKTKDWRIYASTYVIICLSVKTVIHIGIG